MRHTGYVKDAEGAEDAGEMGDTGEAGDAGDAGKADRRLRGAGAFNDRNRQKSRGHPYVVRCM